MKRVRMTVAYDGTNYHGWQLQNNGRTIEGELNRCLSELLGEEIHVTGASRTDAGVHALCNIAVFNTNAKMPADKISYALNQRLPEDIKIRHSCHVSEDFYPRKRKSIKTYEYKIQHGIFPIPTMRLYSYFVYVPLNLHLMREAAAYLEGTHDFKSFCSTASTMENTVRTIYKIDIEEKGEEIAIRISGSGFLYNMVRIIVGTLLEFGQAKYPTEQMREILAAKDREAAGPTAPAKGLTLVDYAFLEE